MLVLSFSSVFGTPLNFHTCISILFCIYLFVRRNLFWKSEIWVKKRYIYVVSTKKLRGIKFVASISTDSSDKMYARIASKKIPA